MMRTTCLINNFNYGRFLTEAVESAFCQTVDFDEVIVVDDGSTDNSRRILSRLEALEPRLKVIAQENAGQLSTFNAGAKAATGELVFFLDADDTYQPDYLERILGVYAERPEVDFVFCGREVFGTQNRIDLPYPTDQDFGYSVAGVTLGHHWIGAPTSCISMRRQILDRLLPADDLLAAWTICADLCMVYGASLARARKYYVAQPLVRYRAHPGNRYFGRRCNRASQYHQRLNLAHLIEYYVKRFGFHRGDLAELLRSEFRTIPQPSRLQFREYINTTLRLNESLGWKFRQLVAMAIHYGATRKGRGSTVPVARPATEPVAPRPLPKLRPAGAQAAFHETPVVAAK